MTCEAWIINNFQSYICGKPSKGCTEDGLEACGVHLAAERRRKERREESDVRRANSDQAYAMAQRLAGELQQLGIDAVPFYKSGGSRLGRYTGQVIVDPAVVLAALKRLAHGNGTPGSSDD